MQEILVHIFIFHLFSYFSQVSRIYMFIYYQHNRYNFSYSVPSVGNSSLSDAPTIHHKSKSDVKILTMKKFLAQGIKLVPLRRGYMLLLR